MYISGEEDDAVPMFDTCDETRRKITLYLRKEGMTKMQFCRALHSQLQSPAAPANIQVSQLNRFRSYKGPTAGCTSSVYYVRLPSP